MSFGMIRERKDRLMKKIIALWIVLALAVSLCPAFAETADELFGEINGDVYKNKLLGIGFTLPAGGQWCYKTQEEILVTNQIAHELMTSEIKKMLEEGQNVSVMRADNSYFSNFGLEIKDIGERAARIEQRGVRAILESQVDEIKKPWKNPVWKSLILRWIPCLSTGGRCPSSGRVTPCSAFPYSRVRQA